jgi:hypothetical protein
MYPPKQPATKTLILDHTYELPLVTPVVAAADIDQLSTFGATFEKLDEAINIQFLIRASIEITDIDPAWIGYLFLMTRRFGSRLQITIKLQENYVEKIRPEPAIKLRQYAVYGQLYLGKLPFKIEVKDGKLDLPEENFNPETFKLSRRFSVPLFIDRAQPEIFDILFKNIDPAFTNTVQPGADTEIIVTNKMSEMQKSLNELFRKRSVPGKQKECLINLGRLAFYRVLIVTRTLNVYMDRERMKNPEMISKNCRAGRLGSGKTPGQINALEYFKMLEPVINELATRPLIYTFFFNLLLSREILPSEVAVDNAKQLADDIQKRWSFCRDLVHGLTELAKNIEEHSTHHFGIITSRIASNKPDQDSNDYSLYQQLFPSLPAENRHDEPPAILEIQVMDLGKEGIVPQLLKHLKEKCGDPNIHPVIKKLYEQDINRISINPVGVDLLLKTKQESPLNHQSKRAVAHLGLLKFSKLIEDNGAALIVITNDLHNQRGKAKIPANAAISFPDLGNETIFRFYLPVKEGKWFKGIDLNKWVTQPDTSKEQLLGLEALMEYQLLQGTEKYKPEEWVEKKLLMTYTPEPFVLSDHNEHLLWTLLDRLFSRHRFVLDDAAKKLFHLDFKNIAFDFSQLFRLLGYWELHYPENPLLISNVKHEVLEELIEMNEAYKTQNPDVHFWNETAPVVIYNYVDIRRGTKEFRFYFADALWGKEAGDFFWMNRVINTYHYNSVTWLQQKKGIASTRSQEDQHWPGVLFNRKYHLLPFDLLLVQDDGRNLFEINTSYTLQNDIQPLSSKHE